MGSIPIVIKKFMFQFPHYSPWHFSLSYCLYFATCLLKTYPSVLPLFSFPYVCKLYEVNLRGPISEGSRAMWF